MSVERPSARNKERGPCSARGNKDTDDTDTREESEYR